MSPLAAVTALLAAARSDLRIARRLVLCAGDWMHGGRPGETSWNVLNRNIKWPCWRCVVPLVFEGIWTENRAPARRGNAKAAPDDYRAVAVRLDISRAIISYVDQV